MTTSQASTSSTSNQIVFAAVPWIRTQQPFPLGSWILWPNTKANWLARTGTDLTDFMSMYRDRNGKPVNDSGSVLTRADGAEATQEEFHRAIIAYSTLAWLDRAPCADAWMFEVWRVPPNATKSMTFRRLGKFTINFTSPENERVVPSPYTFPATLRSNLPGQLITFIAAEMAKPDVGSIMRALGQFHEVRFETPYFNTQGDDLEALWSGFESMYLREEDRSAVSKIGIVRRLLNLFVRKSFPRRSERLSNAIRSDLENLHSIRADVLTGVAQWAEMLWEARNRHSHAGHADPLSAIESLNSTVLSVGLRLAEALLSIRIWRAAGDVSFLLVAATERVNEIFLLRATVEHIVSTLKGSVRTDWYPPTEDPNYAERLTSLGEKLKDLISFKNVEGWRGERDVAKARGVMRRVLTAWLQDLLANQPSGADLTLLSSFPAQDKAMLQALKAQNLTGPKLEDTLDEDLVAGLVQNEPWRLGALGVDSSALSLGGIISVQLWARAYVRLQEIFIGYELV